MTAEKQSSFSKSSYKVLFLGEYGVGKSSFIIRLMEKRFVEGHSIDPAEAVFTKSFNVGNQRINLRIVDTQGVERFRALTSSSFRDAAVLVFVFDLSKLESFKKLDDWQAECQRYGAKKKFIKVLIGTKNDLVDQRAVTVDEARQFALTNGMSYFEASAKTGENVDEAAQAMARQISEGDAGPIPRIASLSPVSKDDSAVPAPTSTAASSSFVPPKKDSSSSGGGCVIL